MPVSIPTIPMLGAASPGAGVFSGDIDLTLSGNEITDAVRTTGTEGDGLAVPAGFGIWPAATNLENSAGNEVSFEGGKTGYSAGGTNTVAQSTDQSKFGSNSGKCTYQDDAMLLTTTLTLTNAAHSAKRWIYIPSDYDGTQVRVRAVNFASATGTLSVNADMTKTDQWQEVNLNNFTPAAGDLTGDIVVDETGTPTAGKFIYVDGCQTETGSISTPFDLTARSAARVQLPVSGLFTETQGWVVFRGRMGQTAAAATAANSYWFQWRDDGSNRFDFRWVSSGGSKIRCDRTGPTGTPTSANSAAQSQGVGDRITAAFKWASTQVGISVDGGTFAVANNDSIPVLSATSADIASATGTSNWLNSDILWFVCGSGTLTDADATALDGIGDTAPTMPQLIAAISPAAEVTGLWRAVDDTFIKRSL